jgi:hypothetical protein
MNINNLNFDGKNITIKNNKIIVDGKDITASVMMTSGGVGQSKYVINITGDVENITVDQCEKITIGGNAIKTSTKNGDISVKGNVVAHMNATDVVTTHNGNITIGGDVTGNVATKMGNVKCGNVSGNATTKMGNISKN